MSAALKEFELEVPIADVVDWILRHSGGLDSPYGVPIVSADDFDLSIYTPYNDKDTVRFTYTRKKEQ